MKENYYKQIEQLFYENDKTLSRTLIDKKQIPSWFFYDFIKRNKLVKVAPGIYASDSCFYDEYYVFQRRYNKYIFSGMSALYLLHLTDKIPDEIEVTSPLNYHPSNKKFVNVSITYDTKETTYNYDIIKTKTIFGNEVLTYGYEKMICDLVKDRNDYDGETFVKAIKAYLKRKDKNFDRLYEYAKKINVEDKVFEIMELLTNKD